jgi:DNA-binding MarR family transcriptional regulator
MSLYASPVSTVPTASQTASELRLVLGRLVRRLRAEGSFPISQGSVLSRLEREGPKTASRLASAEAVRPQSMAQIVMELESAGMVSRRPDPDDGRQLLIELTERGATELEEDRRRREGWLARAIETELSAAEQKALAAAVPLIGRLSSREDV